MIKIVLTVFLFAMILMPQSIQAQRRWQRDSLDRPRPERLEKFRKMRLIETLKLNEEGAIRFFAKQSIHEDKIHDLMKTRNMILDDIEKMTDDKMDISEFDKMVDKIKSIDNDIFRERERYQEEIKQLLSPVQFGKYLVFERNFGRQVREAIDEMSRGHRDRSGD